MTTKRCPFLRGFFILVAGGIPFASTTPAAGSLQALALGLVPAGLTPVAFFPPTQNQTMPAFSVIFQEAEERQPRSMKYKGNVMKKKKLVQY